MQAGPWRVDPSHGAPRLPRPVKPAAPDARRTQMPAPRHSRSWDPVSRARSVGPPHRPGPAHVPPGTDAGRDRSHGGGLSPHPEGRTPRAGSLSPPCSGGQRLHTVELNKCLSHE